MSTTVKPYLLIVVLLLGATLLSACQRQQPAEPSPEPSVEAALESAQEPVPAAEPGQQLGPWDQFVSDYIEAFLAAHPGFAVAAGRHEFDGQLPDWSGEGIATEIARMKSARDTALGFSKDQLTAKQHYQRDYLVARIDRDLFWLDKAEWPFRSPQFYFDWILDSLDPSPYITLDYASLAERMESYIKYANNLPRALAQIQANLRTPMPRTYVEYGVSSFGGFADYFANDVPLVFSAVDDLDLKERFAEANDSAITAMYRITRWFESQRESATDDFALGESLYLQMLADTEGVEISLAELEAIGRSDMQRNQAALATACQEFAPGESIATCFATMANRKPEGGAVAAARRHLEETKIFLVEQDLVSIPGTEEALVEESPPYARSNSAYINIPGPYEKDQPSIYYISPPDPDWSEEVQRAYVPGESDLLFTSIHEVWPGHFLNFLHANRSDWIFGRTFVGYAFAEGWAHYTEELMVEAGIRDGSPETRIGQLSNALLRNARYLSSIGLHTKGMTVTESEALFKTEAYQDEGTARQQAARGTYDPGYLNYTMGKLMIRKLRDDWSASRGGRAAWRDFHDSFLAHGGPPIPLVRGSMMATEPAAVFYQQEQ